VPPFLISSLTRLRGGIIHGFPLVPALKFLFFFLKNVNVLPFFHKFPSCRTAKLPPDDSKLPCYFFLMPSLTTPTGFQPRAYPFFSFPPQTPCLVSPALHRLFLISFYFARPFLLQFFFEAQPSSWHSLAAPGALRTFPSALETSRRPSLSEIFFCSVARFSSMRARHLLSEANFFSLGTLDRTVIHESLFA